MTLLSHRFPALLAVSTLVGTVLCPLYARAQSSVQIDDIAIDHFRMDDGRAVGTVRGHAFGPDPGLLGYNLFSSHERVSAYGTRRSPYSFRAGPFHFRMEGTLNHLMETNPVWLFISPSNNGSHLQSPRVPFRGPIVLPDPSITTATSNEHTVLLTGSAVRGARVQLKLRGQQHIAIAGSDGSWSHRFSGVPQGRHWVSAQVVDITGQFRPSSSVEREVVSEGTITRPLTITTPAPNGHVRRSMLVGGVASPDRGTVRVSVGGGATVEASVNRNQHIWSARVQSNAHGTVPLTVSLPYTGEQVTQMVQVAPFNDLMVNRAVMKFAPWERSMQMVMNGMVDLQTDDTEVLYLARVGSKQEWKHLTTIDEEGHWSYEGAQPADMIIGGGDVDGIRYPSVLTLNVPSAAGTSDDWVTAPYLRAASELTSPLRVGRSTVLTGMDWSGALTIPVEVVLPDGRRLSAMPDSQGRWSLPVDHLALGRLAIDVGKAVPDALRNRFEVRRIVLEVVDTP